MKACVPLLVYCLVLLPAHGVAQDPAGDEITRGEYLFEISGCRHCHTADDSVPLAGGRPLDTLVQPVQGAGFDAMHVGERDPAQIQLLLEDHFPRLIAEAQQSYETVIVDAPPIVGSPELSFQ